jgi:hypothetical protein
MVRTDRDRGIPDEKTLDGNARPADGSSCRIAGECLDHLRGVQPEREFRLLYLRLTAIHHDGHPRPRFKPRFQQFGSSGHIRRFHYLVPVGSGVCRRADHDRPLSRRSHRPRQIRSRSGSGTIRNLPIRKRKFRISQLILARRGTGAVVDRAPERRAAELHRLRVAVSPAASVNITITGSGRESPSLPGSLGI